MKPRQSFRVLVADDEPIMHTTIGDYLRSIGHHVDTARDGHEALEMLAVNEFDLVMLDLRMPKLDGMQVLARIQEHDFPLPVVMITGHGNMEDAIRALRLGAADFLTKPIQLRDLVPVLERCILVRGLREKQERLRETLDVVQRSERRNVGFRGLVGSSPALKKIREQLQRAIEAQCETVLITGETGVGKEVVARELHLQDRGGKDPFIAVNCAAIPESLVENELFGHVRGAFTGAFTGKAGCFELAHGGTLLLDEIADLSAAAQAKFLRVLETRTVRRIGSSRENDVSVRVVAATNVPLEKLVSAALLRKDLFYRLSLFRIDVPPLRSHKEDIPSLAKHFLRVFAEGRQIEARPLSAAALEKLQDYDYPGNVRELRNLVERAAIMGSSDPIGPDEIEFSVIQPVGKSMPPDSGFASVSATSDAMDSEDRDRLRTVLEKYHWNRRKAADELGLSYSGLRYKINKYGLR